VAADHNIPAFAGLCDLASARVGARALAASDEFFAGKGNLLKPSPAIFIPDKFTARGKWMDGWESRRRRTPGHDWCVVKLGMRGRIRGFNVNTAFFTGNFPSHCSIDALDTPRVVTKRLAATEGSPWVRLVDETPLLGDSDNFIAVENDRAWTHVRLNIFPDGGVARLRVYGDVIVDWQRATAGKRVLDLAAIEHGGLVLAASDMHYGAKDNIIMPGRAVNMGDGWETKRRRGPGHDWLILRLGAPARVHKVEIDTNHFKGNYPDAASIEGCFAPAADVVDVPSVEWTELLPKVKLRPHHRHFFARELRDAWALSHLRLNIYPDGGISRLRVHGTVAGNQRGR
jgi:allantoicase